MTISPSARQLYSQRSFARLTAGQRVARIRAPSGLPRECPQQRSRPDRNAGPACDAQQVGCCRSRADVRPASARRDYRKSTPSSGLNHHTGADHSLGFKLRNPIVADTAPVIADGDVGTSREF